jgi:hypothetical protein
MPDYCEVLLHEANGAVLLGGALRVFGFGPSRLGRDAQPWNRSTWRALYRLPADLLLWGENCFGDQYGVDGAGNVVILRCEGGELEVTPFRSMGAFIGRVIDQPLSGNIDEDLVRAAHQADLTPGLDEHLSFILPLVCGGAATGENLEVMDASGHLELLGQIVQQTRDLPEGTKIDGFVSKE